MSTLRITCLSEVDNKTRFVESFCQAPQTLRKDPYRVGLLAPDADALFLTLPLPVPREFWVAERDGSVVGRVGASVSGTDPHRGTMGFFEVDPGDQDTSAALLSAALAWLRDRRVKVAYGPIHINTWFPYRFRVGGTDDRNYSWEPVNPPEYPRMFESAGFVRDQRYHSELMNNLSSICRSFQGAYESAVAAGYSFRPIDTLSGLDKEIPILYKLSLEGFVNNHLFEPIPEQVFRLLYVAQARKRKPVGCFFVCHPSEGEVGFIVGFEDEAGNYIGKTLVVLPAHQGRGVSIGLLHVAYGSALQSGYGSMVGALIQIGNRSEASSRRTTLSWQHEYALFRKTLT